MAHPPTRPSDARLLALLLGVALLIRLGWGLSRPADDAAFDALPDQRGYLEAARNLLHGNGLWYVDERFGQRVYAVRTPGYPAFVAACGGSVHVVRIVQALIDTSTALAIYLLARRLLATSHGAAPLIACCVVAFNPFLVYFSALVLTETLYTAMLAWSVAIFLLRPRHGWPWAVLLLGLAIHVRPAGIGLPVVLGVAAVWAGGQWGTNTGARVRHSVTGAVIAIVATAIVLLPWAWRNERILGRWVWSTSNDGITAYDGFHPGATGASDQQFVTAMPELRTMGELERSDYLAAEAKKFARENPDRVLRLTLAKVARTWSPVPLSDEFGTPLHQIVALAFALPFDVLVVVGVAAGRLPRRVKVFLLLPALYFTGIHALSVGSLRYRVPAEPPLAVLAAVGTARLLGGRENSTAAKTSEDDALCASSSAG